MKIIDSHFHWWPRSIFDDLCRRTGFPRAELNDRGGYAYLGAPGSAPVQSWAEWFDLDRQLEHMDGLGHEVSVVSSIGPFSIYFSELEPEAGRDAQAIVILGGGILPDAREYGGDSVTAFSLERARYGAFVARERRLPVAVSGGVVMRGRPEADVIGDLLEREFGVPVRWREVRSRNTHENAVESARLLLPLGVRRILLVTHAVDARRGRREMEAAGFEVVLAPTLLPRMDIRSPLDLFPSMAGYRGSYYALYEVLGNLKASLDGLP